MVVVGRRVGRRYRKGPSRPSHRIPAMMPGTMSAYRSCVRLPSAARLALNGCSPGPASNSAAPPVTCGSMRVRPETNVPARGSLTQSTAPCTGRASSSTAAHVRPGHCVTRSPLPEVASQHPCPGLPLRVTPATTMVTTKYARVSCSGQINRRAAAKAWKTAAGSTPPPRPLCLRIAHPRLDPQRSTHSSRRDLYSASP